MQLALHVIIALLQTRSIVFKVFLNIHVSGNTKCHVTEKRNDDIRNSYICQIYFDLNANHFNNEVNIIKLL